MMRAFVFSRCCPPRSFRDHGHRGRGTFHGSGNDGHDFGVGRKLRSSDLQLVILSLVAQTPRHGYEIIKAVEHISKGYYSPSPGMVYPALTYLEEDGYASVENEGTKRRFHITDAGRAFLSEHRAHVDALVAQLARVGAKLERMRQFFGNEDAGADAGHAEVDRARRDLRNALAARLASSPSAEELDRIAEILRRATDDLHR